MDRDGRQTARATAGALLWVALVAATACSPDAQDREVARWQQRDDAAAAEQLGGSRTSRELIWGEVKKLIANDATPHAYLGGSVAVGKHVALVGAHLEDAGGQDAGAAYLFIRYPSGPVGWGQLAKLTASDAQADNKYGHAVGLSAPYAIVGAPFGDAAAPDAGSAYVYKLGEGGSLAEVALLTAADAESGDEFGDSVGLAGDIVIVGASREGTAGTNAGAAYLFERNEGGTDGWGQLAQLAAADAAAESLFGYVVAVSSDTAIVGAPLDDHGSASTEDFGAAYVFSRDQGGPNNWGQVAKLVGAAETNELFGFSVAIDGDTAVVGALNGVGSVNDSGTAYVFERNQGGPEAWGQVAKLMASDGTIWSRFGEAVHIEGDRVIVGAPDAVSIYGWITGAAYVFLRNLGGPDHWGMAHRISALDGQDNDKLGTSVAIHEDTFVVGAIQADGSATNTGAAYVFFIGHTAGSPCAESSHCVSGYCQDGVCCSSNCGDDPLDCYACSAAAGATVDGACSPLADGSGCDDGVFCNGTELCAAGLCSGDSGSSVDPCADQIGDADDDCSESCDETSASCVAPDPDGSSCNGGDGSCAAGLCLGNDGSACEEAAACHAGNCVDGVCCTEPSCAPYRCGLGGLCSDDCTSTADCVGGYECDAAGKCVPPVTTVTEEGDCGCLVPGLGDSDDRWAWVALLGLALAARRRRS